MRGRLIFISNAVDDETRRARGITGDSPAASRKVFLASKCIRTAGVRPIVLSLGRGKSDNSGRYYKAMVRRVNGVPVVYCPFSHYRALSFVLALFGPIPLLWRIARLRGEKTAVFYNRVPLYVPALLTAVAFRWRRVLDLEDGEIGQTWRQITGAITHLTRIAFDGLSNGGALLACSSLAKATTLRPVKCFYGTTESHAIDHDWEARPLVVLMCGAIWEETGALLLVKAIEKMRDRSLPWSTGVKFVITGSGPCLLALQKLEQSLKPPHVTVLGRTTDTEYREILATAHVGLALKLHSSALATTTFPSKVVEFASAGLAVLTTDISDVRTVFGDAAIYLEQDDPELLFERLRLVVTVPDEAQRIAAKGYETINRLFSPRRAGQQLADFLFPRSA